MKSLAHYLHQYLHHTAARNLLALYPDNDAVKILKAEFPKAEVWDLLSVAMQSGVKPQLPIIDFNKRGSFRPIRKSS